MQLSRSPIIDLILIRTMSFSYRNQSICFHFKSINWFQYDRSIDLNPFIQNIEYWPNIL